MSVRTYNVGNVKVLINGAPVTGYGSGDAIRITTQPQYTTQIGVDGSGSRSRSNNKSAVIEINLMQTSTWNLYFNNQKVNDDSGGLGLFGLAIVDTSPNGGSNFIAEKAWIAKEPDYAFGGEAQEWTWTIETDNLTSFPLGNDVG